MTTFFQQGVRDLADWIAPEEQNDEESRRRQALRKYQASARPGTYAVAPHGTIGMVTSHPFFQMGTNALAGAVSDTNSAIADEMKSRVNQEREMRRMQHEQELVRMRANADMYGAAIRSLLS